MSSFKLLTRILSLTFVVVSGKLYPLILLISVKFPFLIVIFLFCELIGKRLNEFVSHFEPLNYDINMLETRHQRVRRSLDEESTLHFNFKAHGRYCYKTL